MDKLSVVLATRNEEKNIGQCLESVKDLASELIVVDESSIDKTREIAEKHGARVFKTKHEPIFHVTKQKALDKATGDWILQLDADEIVTKDLSAEIKNILKNGVPKEKIRGPGKKQKIFKKHQELVEKRDGKIGENTGEIVAFFVPRLNFFLGKPLKHAGVYPDGVIRLVRRGKAKFPQKSVHEQIQIDGEVAWLTNDLEHHDSPILKRYFSRMNRYTDLHAKELKEKGIKKNMLSFLSYTIFKPIFVFLTLFLRHKGFLDGARGFLWCFFSSLHFPISYFKYWTEK